MIFLPYCLFQYFTNHFPWIDGLKLTVVIKNPALHHRHRDISFSRPGINPSLQGIEKRHRENIAFNTSGLQIGEKSNGGFPEVSMLGNGAFPRWSSLNGQGENEPPGAMMVWDNGLGLTLLPGRFRILSDQKFCEEKNGREK
jgi:hypothetical protein